MKACAQVLTLVAASVSIYSSDAQGNVAGKHRWSEACSFLSGPACPVDRTKHSLAFLTYCQLSAHKVSIYLLFLFLTLEQI